MIPSSLSEPELIAWLTLSFTPRLGGVGLSRLLDIDDPIHLVDYDHNALQSLGLKPAQIRYIKHDFSQDIDECLEWKQKNDCHILTPFCAEYPVLMQEIASMPPVLFAQGELSCLQKPQVAIVGSRHASNDGLKAAYEFARDLSLTGVVITSGLALGVDGYAHDGALKAGGQTVAVLGSGLNVIYPAKHKGLATRIAGMVDNGGALVSELRPNAAPRAEHFPRRNRIISGLSLGVLVVEAAMRSGSLITARYALEQNRDVFALPGSIYQQGCLGSNALLQSGAALVQSAQELLAILGGSLEGFYQLVAQIQSRSPVSNVTKNTQPYRQASLPLSFNEPKIHSSASASASASTLATTLRSPIDIPYPQLFEKLGKEALPVDILVERTHIPVHELMTQLLELELAGMITSTSGGYIRV